MSESSSSEWPTILYGSIHAYSPRQRLSRKSAARQQSNRSADLHCNCWCRSLEVKQGASKCDETRLLRSVQESHALGRQHATDDRFAPVKRLWPLTYRMAET